MRYICSLESQNEWSGILFYHIDGDINDIDNFLITLEGIHLMDIGSITWTGHDSEKWSQKRIAIEDDALIDYMESHDAWDQMRGLIHSHNSMPVYFSDEDKEELRDNVLQHNYYLSVIVNNFEEYCGKVVSFGKRPETEVTMDLKTSDGKPYGIPLYLRAAEYIADFDVEFQLPKSTPKAIKPVKERLDKIREVKKDENKEKKPGSASFYGIDDDEQPWWRQIADEDEQEKRKFTEGNKYNEKKPEKDFSSESGQTAFTTVCRSILSGEPDSALRPMIIKFYNHLLASPMIPIIGSSDEVVQTIDKVLNSEMYMEALSLTAEIFPQDSSARMAFVNYIEEHLIDIYMEYFGMDTEDTTWDTTMQYLNFVFEYFEWFSDICSSMREVIGAYVSENSKATS